MCTILLLWKNKKSSKFLGWRNLLPGRFDSLPLPTLRRGIFLLEEGRDFKKSSFYFWSNSARWDAIYTSQFCNFKDIVRTGKRGVERGTNWTFMTLETIDLLGQWKGPGSLHGKKLVQRLGLKRAPFFRGCGTFYVPTCPLPPHHLIQQGRISVVQGSLQALNWHRHWSCTHTPPVAYAVCICTHRGRIATWMYRQGAYKEKKWFWFIFAPFGPWGRAWVRNLRRF